MKHHYLPQFYLDGFKIIPQKGKYPHIYRIEKTASPTATIPAIKDTGCKNDYHTIDISNQEKDRQAVESALTRIESDQACILKSICKTQRILPTHKKPLADFLMTMRCRVPAMKRYIESSLACDVESTFKILMQQGNLPKPPKDVEDHIQKHRYEEFLKVKISNRTILQYMFRMAFHIDSSIILGNMTYQLIIAPDGSHFITGDSPVALYHPDYDTIRPYGVGPALKEVELTFPISKTLLVKLTWHDDEGTKQAQKDEVQEYNRRTIIMADSQVYSSKLEADLIEDVRRFHRVEAGYKLDSLWYGEGAVQVSRFIPVTP